MEDFKQSFEQPRTKSNLLIALVASRKPSEQANQNGTGSFLRK